jgi:hypothetical protein
MLLQCTKLSQVLIESEATLKDRILETYSSISEEDYKELNFHQKECFFSAAVSFNLLEHYGVKCLHEFSFLSKQGSNVFNNVNQMDLSNRWIFNDMINSLALEENTKRLLKIIFFKLIVDA